MSFAKVSDFLITNDGTELLQERPGFATWNVNGRTHAGRILARIVTDYGRTSYCIKRDINYRRHRPIWNSIEQTMSVEVPCDKFGI